MLCYNRSDVSKEIDVGKTIESKEWYLSLLVFFK